MSDTTRYTAPELLDAYASATPKTATFISTEIGRKVARFLHGGRFGIYLGPTFRTEEHASGLARYEFGQCRLYAVGSFDAAAALESFRAELEQLGGWETATPLV